MSVSANEVSVGPSGATVLQLLQARQMFIGDELRVSTLRMSWTESGENAEDFAVALSTLQQAGLIRTVHGTSGPAVQLTHQGFRATSKPCASVNTPSPSTQPLSAAQQLNAQPTKSRTAKSRNIAMPTAPLQTLELPAAPQERVASATPSLPSTTPDLAHAQVFRTRENHLSDNVFKHCLLGLMQHYRVRTNGHLSYTCIATHWSEMGLSKDDLVYTLDLLLRARYISTVSEPKELVVLTAQGFERCIGAPKDLEDGMDRWRAKKRLRLTKQLGCLPAA